MMRIALAMSVTVFVSAIGISSVAAADIEAGKKKVAEVCAACHGPDGNSATADFPRLAGQHPDYIAKAIRDYKSGARKDPIMGGFAKTLTPKEIENVAAYFSSQHGLQTKY
ncbi:MAG: cytochrome c [Burkholderiales bacterium]|nr:cytochrome c [Burkholderiales bacterium]